MHSVIGSGAFASVYYAYWKGTQVKFAIKKFADDCKEEIIPNEIRLMKKVDYHPNIIRFIGVVKFEDEINYSLILEYANGGTLGKYLRDNADTFKNKWESQLIFAHDIASAISCLHDNKIIHRDLHPDNILIHQGVIKLADFGYSVLRGSDFYTKASRGVIPYMDPKFLENHSYDLTEKSDIYSLGVLFWELTSCSSPFNFATTDGISIQLKILELIREKPITTTNGRFVKLYQKCWQHEPNERPEINQVISELNSISNHSEGKKATAVRRQPPRRQEATRQQETQGVTETPSSQETADTPRQQESVRIEELGNDECLKTEELNNEEIEKTVVDCDISRYDKN